MVTVKLAYVNLTNVYHSSASEVVRKLTELNKI